MQPLREAGVAFSLSSHLLESKLTSGRGEEQQRVPPEVAETGVELGDCRHALIMSQQGERDGVQR